MTFSGRFLLNLIQFATLQGADAQRLLQTSGYTVDELSDEQLRVTEVVYGRVLEQAASSTGDPLLGLHMGEYLNLSAAGIISQITQTSSTVKEAMQYACEFAMLGCRALPFDLIEKQSHYELHITPDKNWQQQWPLAMQQTIDGMLAFTIRQYRALTFDQFKPLRVTLSKQETHTAEYARVLGCPVIFNQPGNAIWLSKETLEQPIVTSDHKLLRSLVAHAEKRLADIEQTGIASLVKQVMLNMGNRQLPTLEDVAANMHISPRTLQRKLAEEGVTYKQLTDSVRQELSMDLLHDKTLSLQDIAYLTGYSDLSTFSRSFKRWTGVAPASYRLKNSA